MEIAQHSCSYKSSTLEILFLIVFRLFTLKVCHLSLKHSLLFNTFNNFNVNKQRLSTIYLTNIL